MPKTTLPQDTQRRLAYTFIRMMMCTEENTTCDKCPAGGIDCNYHREARELASDPEVIALAKVK